jgi:hypothetical protein
LCPHGPHAYGDVPGSKFHAYSNAHTDSCAEYAIADTNLELGAWNSHSHTSATYSYTAAAYSYAGFAHAPCKTLSARPEPGA